MKSPTGGKTIVGGFKIMSVTKAERFHPATRLDERTFEAIFHEHYSKVYAILFRLTGDRYEADDLAAETFWRLWRRPPILDENLSGWLYRVATRLGYNTLRASQRRKRYEAAAATLDSAQVGGQPARSEGDPSRAAEQRIERERVRAILRQLPLRDVQILILRYSGLPYKEIAGVVDVAAGSIGTLLSRAETRFEDLYRRGDKDAPKR
jgi:RNA polymerase sigma-70 factor (ECF subfamily)